MNAAPIAAVVIVVAAVSMTKTVLKTVKNAVHRGRDAGDRLPSDRAIRLERMEQAVESIAIEVERMSESQRFLTKMLAERANVPATSKENVQ